MPCKRLLSPPDRSTRRRLPSRPGERNITGADRPSLAGTGEQGFILIATLVVLLLLVILGISTTTNTNTELQIAGNQKLATTAFYNADGGAEAGTVILEDNTSCPGGFVQTLINGTLQVTTPAFWRNSVIAASPYVTDSARDAFFPANYPTGSSHTNLRFGGVAQATKGSGFQMIAGYEGKGKGAAGGGASIMYDVYSQGVETNNAQTTVDVKWLHVIGQEGDCIY